jgi:hypothetical protein
VGSTVHKIEKAEIMIELSEFAKPMNGHARLHDNNGYEEDKYDTLDDEI